MEESVIGGAPSVFARGGLTAPAVDEEQVKNFNAKLRDRAIGTPLVREQ